ncbi:hypothetical protein ACHAXH_002832 [Discostella pseudostelligera]
MKSNIHPTPNTKSIATNTNSYKSNRNSDIQLSKSLSWVLRHAAPSVGLQLSPDGYVPLAEILALHHPRFRTKDNTPKYTVEDVIRVVKNNDKQRFRLEFRYVGRREVETAAGSSDDASSSSSSLGTENSDSTLPKSQRNCGKDDTNNNDSSDEGTRDNKRVLCIRANQGHSLHGLEADQLLSPLTIEQLSDPTLSIIHGTSFKAWEEHIQHEGLSRRKRNHIHFATGLPSRQTTTVGDKTNNSDNNNNVTPISGMRSTSEIYIYIDGAKCANDGIPFYQSDNGVLLTAGVNNEGMLPTKYFAKVVHAASGTIVWKKDAS